MTGICTKLLLASAVGTVLLGILFYTYTGSSLSSVYTQVEEMAEKSWKDATSVYDFKYTDIDGVEQSMEKFRGHVLIIANVATKCGLTKANYEQLRDLYTKYSESKGLRILGMPCNQFASQEPGTESEIKEFACTNYKIKFDMSSKIDVNGDDAHPLWKYLKDKQGGTLGSFAKWNFTKFLIDKKGQPVKRYSPNTEPKEMEKDLLKYFEE